MCVAWNEFLRQKLSFLTFHTALQDRAGKFVGSVISLSIEGLMPIYDDLAIKSGLSLRNFGQLPFTPESFHCKMFGVGGMLGTKEGLDRNLA